MSPGDKRRRKAKLERERVAYHARVAELRAEGASCATCRCLFKRSIGGQWACTAGSDYYGDLIVELTHLCPKFSPLGNTPHDRGEP